MEYEEFTNNYIDLNIQTEIQTNKGRIDLVAQTEDFFYIMEFKLDAPAKDAIAQIKSREYISKFLDTKKTIYLVGIGFSEKERNVESWVSEEWKR